MKKDALPSGDDMELPSEVEDEPAPSVPSYLDGTIRDDVLELFSPPRVVPRCKEQGLRAVMSIDLVTGFDLLTLDGRQRAMHEVTKRRPTVIISSPPCTWFSAITQMWNAKRFSRLKVDYMRRTGMTLYKFGLEVGRHQSDRGSGFLHEHPCGATSWKLDECCSFAEDCNMQRTTFDQCRVGLKTPKSLVPLRKRTTFMHNMSSAHVHFKNLKCMCKEDKCVVF